MPVSSTSFKEGNKAAVKSPKPILRKMNEMLENSIAKEDILCMYDACRSVKIRQTKIHYWCDRIPVLENIKKEIQQVITARVNKKALNGDFNPTASIWRMKQNGETDQQSINHQNNGGTFNPPIIKFSE